MLPERYFYELGLVWRIGRGGERSAIVLEILVIVHQSVAGQTVVRVRSLLKHILLGEWALSEELIGWAKTISSSSK